MNDYIYYNVTCVCLQSLEPLCEGLEGRSSNPVAVLFDALSHPDADLGADNPSLLEWRFEPRHHVDHMVLGKSRPGGSWQVIPPPHVLDILYTLV